MGICVCVSVREDVLTGCIAPKYEPVAGVSNSIFPVSIASSYLECSACFGHLLFCRWTANRCTARWLSNAILIKLKLNSSKDVQDFNPKNLIIVMISEKLDAAVPKLSIQCAVQVTWIDSTGRQIVFDEGNNKMRNDRWIGEPAHRNAHSSHTR